MYQYFKLAFNLTYLVITLTEPIDLMALLSAANPNANFARNNQAAMDSALIRWHTGRVQNEYSSPMMLGIQSVAPHCRAKIQGAGFNPQLGGEIGWFRDQGVETGRFRYM